MQRLFPRRVGLALDAAKSMTFTPLAEAFAAFTRLIVAGQQLDGSWAAFDILAGESPSAVVGTFTIKMVPGVIIVENVGSGSGIMYIEVVDDTGAQLYYLESLSPVEPGGYHTNESVLIDMPDRPYGLTVNAGHV